MAERSPYVEACDSKAAKIRKRYGFSYNDPLNPFALADSLGIKTIEPKDISGVSEQDLSILRSIGTNWSGASFSLPDERKIVILNPFHDQLRNNITLMEEICHILYHHKPKTKVQLLSSPEINFLDFTKKDETEAYWTAAAVLVPYKALRSLVLKRKTIEEIASHFQVSPELVKFRLNVTKLLNLFKSIQKVRELLEG